VRFIMLTVCSLFFSQAFAGMPSKSVTCDEDGTVRENAAERIYNENRSTYMTTFEVLALNAKG
jgi:hypothetical protein